MSFLFCLEIAAGWFLLAAAVAALALALGIHFYGDDPLSLLDGRTLSSVLDDRDRGRLLAARIAEDREVAAFDDWFALPDGIPRA